MSRNGKSHAGLMDGIYKSQRHIYDVTRKYYLLGRDQLIADLKPEDGQRVVEIGCGTGRNLIAAAAKYPKARFFGLDISQEMLNTAKRNIEKAGFDERITIAKADATNFSLQSLFGFENADRVFYSYTLSMIPQWQEAIQNGFTTLAEDGSLHIVDFGQQEEMPVWFRTVLTKWLKLFHVEARRDLLPAARQIAEENHRKSAFNKPYRGYATSFHAW